MFSLEQRMLYSGSARAFGSFFWSGSEESFVLALLSPFLCVLSWGVPAKCRIAWKSALMAECHRCWWKGLLCPAKDLTSELCPPCLREQICAPTPITAKAKMTFSQGAKVQNLRVYTESDGQDPETPSHAGSFPAAPRGTATRAALSSWNGTQ